MFAMAFSGKRTAKLTDLIHPSEVLEIFGDIAGPISGIAYHSGKVEPGFLFAAIKGEKADGHLYIADALKKGAAAVVYEGEYTIEPPAAGVRVSNSRVALARAAARFFGHPSRSLTMVGITGTNGKTTTSYLIESIFQAAGFKTGVIGTVNYRYGDKTLKAPTTTPQSLDLQELLAVMAEDGVTHVVMEVSSHALEQHRVDEVAFDAVVFTNLSHDHLDYHSTMEDYFQAKARLFSLICTDGSTPRFSMVNIDDPYGHRITEMCRIACLPYGMGNSARFHAEDLQADFTGIRARLTDGLHSITVNSSLVGRVNIYNILAAAGVAYEFGVDIPVIERGLSSLKAIPGRLFPVRGANGVTAFVDYAHTPDALKKTLESVKEMSPARIITVFGCGGDRDRTKRPLMGEIAGQYSDFAVVTSDNPRSEDPLDIIEQIEPGLRAARMQRIGNVDDSVEYGYMVEPDRAKAIILAISMARPNDVVLIAGKGHENYQIIGNTVRDFDDAVEARKALHATP